VLECRVEGAQVAIDDASEFQMVLPRGNEFYRARRGRDAQSPARAREKRKIKKRGDGIHHPACIPNGFAY
jgi:hypothetical protein